MDRNEGFRFLEVISADVRIASLSSADVLRCAAHVEELFTEQYFPRHDSGLKAGSKIDGWRERAVCVCASHYIYEHL